MQHYELILLLTPTIADEALPQAVDKVKKLLTDNSASITKDEPLGRRKLAYEIKKQRQGIYHVLRFDAPTDAANVVERALRLSPEVLRHMLIVARVRTPEDLEREQAIRAKIEARRRAAAAAAGAPKPAAKPEPEQKVSLKELDEKLEKILEETVT